MRTLRFLIAVSLIFASLSFAEAGIIKNFFTNLAGKDSAATDVGQKQPTGHTENYPGKPSQGADAWQTNENYRSPGSKPTGQYGAAGTYTKKPVVIDGTTEKYKNTSWYIENEDYLSPNKNESQKQQRPNSQYGAAGTYTVKPVGGTTEKFSEKYPIPSGNQQQRPTGFSNNNNYKNNNNHEATQGRRSEGDFRVRETTRSSIANFTEELKTEERNNADNVVLQADDVTCCYSNIKDKIENRTLRCGGIDCYLDKVYEKSSLWVCDAMKCTIASVDFSVDQGNKKLLECSDGRNIISVQDKPLNCGPNERAHNGKCRKVFDAAKYGVSYGC